MKKTRLMLALSMLLGGCYYDNEEELYPSPTTSGGDTTVVVKYSSDIEPLINQHCYGCHSAASYQAVGKVNLEGYANAKSAAQKPKFVQCVRWEQGCNMPPSGRLPADQLQKIERWISQNFPE